MIRLDIGGGGKPREGFINVDQIAAADVCLDIERDRLPWDDDSVDEVYSSHCFEHLRNLHHPLHEIVRVCKTGAPVEIRVPHWHHPMAHCPGHVHTISEDVVRHWCHDFPQNWFPPEKCRKRLIHVATHPDPAPTLALREARNLFPQCNDDQLRRLFPGCCHELRYHFRVAVW